jgi:nitronate monooxygenase
VFISTKLKPLVIGDKVAPLPIVQGGMGVGISLSGLSSAVANAGGIGVIAAAGIGMYEPDFYKNYLQANARALRDEIRKAKRLTGGILGLNIMVALSNYGDLMRVALEEGIDIVFSGAGMPMNMPEYLQPNSHTKLAPIVSSGRAARLVCKRWLSRYDYLPDAVVVEGPKAGGHLGFTREHLTDPAFALERLVPEVTAVVRDFSERYGKPIPVIAAGGIYTGADIRVMLELGADAVQMGTRFVATHECDADIAFKQAYIDARAEDIVIIESPVGMPGRAIRNKYLDDVGQGIKKPYKCPYHCILSCDYQNSPYCIAHALISAKRGKFRSGFAFAGANVDRVDRIVSVDQLMSTLVAEYEQSVCDKVA